MNSFTKEERLCSRKDLDLLFHKGSSFLLYPFRISFLLTDPEPGIPVQVVVNVPKKRYKRAVDRNLLKRRIRAIYRLNKQENLYIPLKDANKRVLLALQFVGKEIYPSDFLNKKLLLALKRLLINIQQHEDN